MVESDSSSSPDPKDIVPREKEKERENPLEAASSVLILKCFPALLLRKDKNRFPDLLTKLSQEDWVQKELQELENFSVSQRPKVRNHPKSLP